MWGRALDGAGDRRSWGSLVAKHLNEAERGPGARGAQGPARERTKAVWGRRRVLRFNQLWLLTAEQVFKRLRSPHG